MFYEVAVLQLHLQIQTTLAMLLSAPTCCCEHLFPPLFSFSQAVADAKETAPRAGGAAKVKYADFVLHIYFCEMQAVCRTLNSIGGHTVSSVFLALFFEFMRTLHLVKRILYSFRCQLSCRARRTSPGLRNPTTTKRSTDFR